MKPVYPPGSMTIRRSYAGQSAADRQQDRRARLIAAAIALYGSGGYRNASVRAVCQQAGLTERYFYESFANSEALLTAAFEKSVANLLALIEPLARDRTGDPPARVRRILTSYYRQVSERPVAARVFLLETSGVSPTLDALFAESLMRLTDPVARVCGGDGMGERARLRRRGIAGSLLHIAIAWIAEDFARPLDEVVDAAMPFALLIQD